MKLAVPPLSWPARPGHQAMQAHFCLLVTAERIKPGHDKGERAPSPRCLAWSDASLHSSQLQDIWITQPMKARAVDATRQAASATLMTLAAVGLRSMCDSDVPTSSQTAWISTIMAMR